MGSDHKRTGTHQRIGTKVTRILGPLVPKRKSEKNDQRICIHSKRETYSQRITPVIRSNVPNPCVPHESAQGPRMVDNDDNDGTATRTTHERHRKVGTTGVPETGSPSGTERGRVWRDKSTNSRVITVPGCPVGLVRLFPSGKQFYGKCVRSVT